MQNRKPHLPMFAPFVARHRCTRPAIDSTNLPLAVYWWQVWTMRRLEVEKLSVLSSDANASGQSGAVGNMQNATSAKHLRHCSLAGSSASWLAGWLACWRLAGGWQLWLGVAGCGWLAGWLAGWVRGKLSSWPAGPMWLMAGCSLAGPLAGWLGTWLTDLLPSWLVGCVAG